MKRVILAAGGTGGHLFPAEALAEELKDEGYELLFVGSGLQDNPFFNRVDFPHVEITSATPRSKNPLKLLKAFFQIAKGFFESLKIIQNFRPDFIVGFGSYHTFPLMLAAKLRAIPLFLHVRDCIPGRVDRFFSPYAALTLVHFEESKKFLRGSLKLAKMPLRKKILKQVLKSEALHYYGLEAGKLTLLIFGGSQGALYLNQIVQETIPHLDIQVIHLTGKEGAAAIKNYYQQKKIPHAVKAFETEMAFAWQAADLTITRAGALSIAEQIEFSVPGILVPYPTAADNHQEKNADCFQRESGAVVKMNQKELTPEKLCIQLKDLIARLPEKRKKLQEYKQKRVDATLLASIKEIIQ